jgi:hypothetical protein
MGMPAREFGGGTRASHCQTNLIVMSKRGLTIPASGNSASAAIETRRHSFRELEYFTPRHTEASADHQTEELTARRSGLY